jgi:methyl-accepting chemotaxis protein-1 (serine sensor receptor)
MVNIKTRLACIFAALGLLCLAVAGAGLYGMSDANDRAERTYRELTLPAQYLKDGYPPLLLTVLQVFEANHINDPVVSKSQFEVIDWARGMFDEQLNLLRKSKRPAIAEELMQQYIGHVDAAMKGALEAAQLSKQGDVTGSMQTMGEKSRPHGVAAGMMMGKLTALFNKEAEDAHAQATIAYHRMQIGVAAAVVVGGLLCGLAVWLQMRAIGSSLGNIQGTLNEVSHSLDLTQRATPQRQDEIGRTASAFNVFIQRVEAAVGDVRNATDSVQTAATEIASGNADLSVRTEQQAAALEQSASGIGALTEAVTANAGNAQHAHTLANQASALANKSETAVQAVMQTINFLDKDAAKIADITGMIEGIAFQTNILALNAAVEAARAGEQGRGFAVVASEVRALAQRSSGAAKEIKSLIDSSTKMISDGTKQATEAGAAMGQLKQSIVEVFGVVGTIADASHEQSKGIERISRTMVELDGMTQQNAALVEQAAAASLQLEEQAKRLHSVVSQFHVGAATPNVLPVKLRLLDRSG